MNILTPLILTLQDHHIQLIRPGICQTLLLPDLTRIIHTRLRFQLIVTKAHQMLLQLIHLYQVVELADIRRHYALTFVKGVFNQCYPQQYRNVKCLTGLSKTYLSQYQKRDSEYHYVLLSQVLEFLQINSDYGQYNFMKVCSFKLL